MALLMIRELAVMARQHNLTALERSEELSELLAGTGLTLRASGLAKLFGRLDFRVAARQIEELMPLLAEYLK